MNIDFIITKNTCIRNHFIADGVNAANISMALTSKRVATAAALNDERSSKGERSMVWRLDSLSTRVSKCDQFDRRHFENPRRHRDVMQ